MATAMKTKESNGVEYACCPNCSKMYRLTEDGKPVELPSKCKRCSSPMDPDKALAFSDEQARKGHNPMLVQMGERMRAMSQPTADRMVRGAPNK